MRASAEARVANNCKEQGSWKQRPLVEIREIERRAARSSLGPDSLFWLFTIVFGLVAWTIVTIGKSTKAV